MNTSKAATELLKFLDLSKTGLIDKFILSHTHGNNGKTKIQNHSYGTIRNSISEALAWKDNIENTDISEVQSLCAQPMKLLGYNVMNDIPNNKMNDSFTLIGNPSKQFQ